MNKNLFLAALMLAICGASVSAQEAVKSMPASIQPELKKTEFPKFGSKTVNPYLRDGKAGAARISGEESVVLYEDFEEWNGLNDNWLPERWQTERKVSATDHQGWRIYKPASMYDEIQSVCMVFDAFYEAVDEWLISPEVRVQDGMQLSWLCYPSPVYYFDPSYIDWSTYSFTEMHIINDFKVYITDDNGENWTLLKSVAEDFADITNYMELYRQTKERTYTIDLSEYDGKEVRIAFNIAGEPEGNTAMVDNVTIAYPALDVSYSRPSGSLFFGLSEYDEYVPASIMVTPVFEPVLFTNTSTAKDAIYSWTYTDTDGTHTSDFGKSLTVTYKTDYSSEFSTRNNLYEMPVLTGSADKYADTKFTYPGFLQAGGKGEFEIHYTDTNEYEVIDLGLGILDPMTEGTATYADIAVPYFGYNQSSDWFWTNQMLNGDTDYTMDENTYSHLEQIGNLFYSSDTPMVISGARINGYGKIKRNAKFVASIYLVDSGWVISEEPYATAECTGDDIIIIDRYSASDFLSFNFKFDEPIVMSKAVSPYYMVTISGFRDEKNVEYFSPEMSEYDNPDKLAFGWVGLDNKFDGYQMPLSWAAVYYIIDRYVGFYIMLDATFPWMQGGEDTLTIGENGIATLKLDTYYFGKDLKLEGMPEWLGAECYGRYDDAGIEFKSTSDKDASATVTISAPGVEKTVTVITRKVDNAGIGGISVADLDGEAEIYTLTGLKVNGKPAPGVYIIRHSDGRTEKSLIR